MKDYSFNTKLSKEEMDLYSKLWVLLKAEGRTVFSADDFQAYRLDRFIEDTQHGIGSFFSKLKINKLIEPTGNWKVSTLKSNHGHKQQLFKMRGLETTTLLNCPFCRCCFTCQNDLEAHLSAFQDRNVEPNKRDHTLLFSQAHFQLEKWNSTIDSIQDN